MNASSGRGPTLQEDLGAGFHYLQREDGQSIIMATNLRALGAVGMIVPAPLDSKDEGELRRWLEAWGYPANAALRQVNQVHGARVVGAAEVAHAPQLMDADGIWTESLRDVLVILSADCAVVWIVDPIRKLLAMVHAGWRGIAEGAIGAGARALETVGAHPEYMYAAVGPHLGACCFEVGPEVATLFEQFEGAIAAATKLKTRPKRADGAALDLSVPIRAELEAAGITPEAIAICSACTRCRADILHSYRRNGPGGPLMGSLGSLLV